jgi:epoxide hydrolase 4
MIRSGRRRHRRTISPGEIFPAGHPGYRTSFERLSSGLSVRVVESGDQRAPPVLLVPGWGCSVYAYRHTMPALATAGYRVIAADLKGHGLSDKPLGAAEYTIESLVDHLRQILDALGLDRPLLVGHSMGGSLLYHFASRYPDRAGPLALLSPVGLSGVPPMRLYRSLTPRFLLPLLRLFRPRLPVKIALRRVYGERGTFTEEDVDQYWAPIRLPDSTLALRELLHSYDWHASERLHLEPVRVPAIGIWGSLDHLMPEGGMQLYERLIPGIELHEVVGAGHVVPEETPEEVNAALISFFRRHSAPGYIARE